MVKYDFKKIKRLANDSKEVIPFTGQNEFMQWRDILADRIYLSRRRVDNKLAQFQIQLAIYLDLISINSAVDNYKKWHDHPEELSEYPLADKNEQESLVKYWEFMYIGYRRLYSAFLDIGDGILWRCLNYNRPVLYELANNNDPGPATFSSGRYSELHELADIYNDKEITRFAFHAISNFGRIGDFTVKKKDGAVDFYEIKSGEKGRGKKWNERLARQDARLERLTTYASTGSFLDDDGNVWQLEHLSGKPRLAIDRICKLVKKISTGAIEKIRINHHLSILAVNLDNFEFSRIDERAGQEMKNEKRETDDDIWYNSTATLFDFSPNRTPLSLYPVDPELIADIMIGRIGLFYFFNLSAFLRQVEKNNWKVSSDGEKIIFQRNGFSFHMNGYLLYRVVFEGMSVESCLEICELGFQGGPGEGDRFVLHEWEDEFRLWR